MTPEQEFANMIMDMTQEEFDIWASHMSEEEIERATYTIRLASKQVREQLEGLLQEEEKDLEDKLAEDTTIEYFPDAQEILDKFTLYGLK